MKKKDRDYVCSVISEEGFDYGFIHYGDFSEIEDSEFHKLREEFIQAYNKLSECIKYEEYLMRE